MQRAALRRLFCALQSDMALLGSAHAAHLSSLVSTRGAAACLDSQSRSWVRRWADVFLDGFLLVNNCHRPWLVCAPILSSHLHRALGLVLRIAQAAGDEAEVRHDEMGSDAGSGPKHSSDARVGVDKILKQLAGRILSLRCVGHAGVVTRLGILWVRLEWPRRRSTR